MTAFNHRPSRVTKWMDNAIVYLVSQVLNAILLVLLDVMVRIA